MEANKQKKKVNKIMLNTTTKVGIIAAVVAGAVAVVPALKGPWNRAKTYINESLNDEFCVDNYKAMYNSLYDKKVECKKSIEKFNVEMRVLAKKELLAGIKAFNAKSALKAAGTSDMVKFAKAKEIYETFLVEQANYKKMSIAYSNAVAKLETSLKVIESSMVKAKANVSSLESKKECVTTLKSVNKIVEDLRGVGDTDLAVSLERLDDDELRESIKLEALSDKPVEMTEAEAKAYIESL